MAGLYTWGDWYVKAGSEQAFIEAWREFGEWTAANVPENTFAKLLQDDADPRHFISFGPGVTRARWQRGVSTQGSRIGSGACRNCSSPSFLAP
jgi:hypothetical protein